MSADRKDIEHRFEEPSMYLDLIENPFDELDRKYFENLADEYYRTSLVGRLKNHPTNIGRASIQILSSAHPA